MKKFLSIGIMLCFSLYATSQISFPSGTYFSVGSSPTSLCNADFNNDGNMDFASGNFNGNSITIRPGNGLGGFGTAVTIPASANINGVTSADFNNDGKKDLAYINPNLYSISIKLGNGLLGFGAATTFGVAVGPNAIISADFNNDGNMDIATCNSNTITVRLGNGAGSFGAAANYTAGNQVMSLVANDFNNDGYKDIATANLNSFTLSVFINNGSGGFGLATNYAVPSGPDGVTSADFNNDGNQDLVSSNYDVSNISILLGNGLGGFSSPSITATGSYPLGITHADYNGDGKMDIATANPYADSITVLLGNGLGGFAPGINFFIANGPYAIISTDFNNDGLKDIATPNYIGDNVCVLINNTGFSITASAGLHGSISPAGTSSVPIGGTQMYTITPSNCYHISNVFVDGVSVGAVSNYTFSSVLASHTISALFSPDSMTGSSSETACTSYTWVQNGNTTYTSSGIYQHTFTTALGCDSVHTLALSIGCSSLLNIKLFFQGFYIGSNMMTPVLFNAGVTGNTLLADSIEVELHNIASPFAMVASFKTTLHTDGIVNLNCGSLSGIYYLVIKHRSSITTWSSSYITLNSSTPANYDFSNAANKTYGDNAIPMGAGVWAIYSGDLNQDDNIDLLDEPILQTEINNFSSGYQATDLNGDGNVDLLDYPILGANIDNFIFSAHP
ncbi:MAG: VCBS repeat-containing protein [Bacteroidetes bacterium]|nr:VCBS repeat-containing protein [Bacteroidota bacterium]